MMVSQTRFRLLFAQSETDCTEDLRPDLLSFSYSDKESGEADELTLRLKDEAGKWAGKWAPDGGETVKAYLIPGTTALAGLDELYCGKFFVDALRAGGSPRTLEMRAISVPLNLPIRRKLNTKAWEKQTAGQIAKAIADAHGMELFYDTEGDPLIDRLDQKEESDLSFLNRLCQDNGFSIKVTDTKLVIFDQSKYEKQDPVKTFVLGVSPILSWSFERQQSDSYKSVTVTWRNSRLKQKASAGSRLQKKRAQNGAKDPKTNPAVMTYTYTDPNADPAGQEFKLHKRAPTFEDAKRLAKAKLRQLNLKKVTGDMTVVGDISLLAGVVINLVGFGSFDGHFIVESSNHSVDSSGYRTHMQLRRVNSEY